MDKRITIGKLLGFLGVTADITGFNLDNSILMIAFGFAAFLQVLKNEAEKESREETKSEANVLPN